MSSGEDGGRFVLSIDKADPEYSTQWFNTGVPDEAVLAIVEVFLRKAKDDYFAQFVSGQ